MVYAVVLATLLGLLMVFFSSMFAEGSSVVGAIFATTVAIIVDFLVSLFLSIAVSTFSEDAAGPVGIASFAIIMLVLGIAVSM